MGSRLEIRLRPSLLDGTHPRMAGDAPGRFPFAADVLTHECIHQWQQEITGKAIIFLLHSHMMVDLR